MELKHVAVDELVGRPVGELKAIKVELRTIFEAVQSEIQRQLDEASAAFDDGGTLTSEAPPARKRGRKSNAEKAAEAATKAQANGQDDESFDEVELAADA